jgi:hypothetical protein
MTLMLGFASGAGTQSGVTKLQLFCQACQMEISGPQFSKTHANRLI